MSHKKPISLSLNSDCAISNLEPMEPSGFEPAHLKGLTASMLCDLALLSGIADENSQRDTLRTGKQSQKKASESEKRGEKPQVKKEQEEVAKSEEFEKSLDEDIARAMKEEEEGVDVPLGDEDSSREATELDSVAGQVNATAPPVVLTKFSTLKLHLESPESKPKSSSTADGAMSGEEQTLATSITKQMVEEVLESVSQSLGSESSSTTRKAVGALMIERGSTDSSSVGSPILSPTDANLSDASTMSIPAETPKVEQQQPISASVKPESTTPKPQLKLGDPNKQTDAELRSIMLAHLQVGALKALSVLMGCSKYIEMLLVPKTSTDKKSDKESSSKKQRKGSFSSYKDQDDPARIEEDSEGLPAAMRTIMRQLVKRAVMPSPIRRVVCMAELERAHAMLLKVTAQAPFTDGKDTASKIGKCLCFVHLRNCNFFLSCPHTSLTFLSQKMLSSIIKPWLFQLRAYKHNVPWFVIQYQLQIMVVPGLEITHSTHINCHGALCFCCGALCKVPHRSAPHQKKIACPLQE